MKRTADINEILKPLEICPEQAYLSSAIQVADILDWIIKQYGPVEVWQTSFSISEEFLRRLFFINKRSHGITQYRLILDFKATNKTLSLWPFICQTISDVFLADNHSKILLAQNKKKTGSYGHYIAKSDTRKSCRICLYLYQCSHLRNAQIAN